jgi:hypothetical protein
LLAASSDRMRVAVETQCDTIELHRVDAGWRTERGAAIEIEALIAIPGIDAAELTPPKLVFWSNAGPLIPCCSAS